MPQVDFREVNYLKLPEDNSIHAYRKDTFNEQLINLANLIEEINTEEIRLKVTAGVSCLALQQAFFDLYRILPDNIKTYTPDIAEALRESVNQQALVGLI